MKTVPAFRAFYTLMDDLRRVRRGIVRMILGGDPVPADEIRKLHDIRSLLHGMPSDTAGTSFFRTGDGFVPAELTYETASLEKDLAFLEKGGKEYEEFLLESDVLRTVGISAGAERPSGSGARHAVDEAVRLLSGRRFRTFVTDRDGTINDYCGRYRSSIQPIHAAVFVSRFAASKSHNPLVLTSAPLRGGGLLDVSASPDAAFHYAGSNGFEYRSRTGADGRYPLGKETLESLDRLNRRLSGLLERPEYEIFGLTGSGFQKKTGMTVVAHQDVFRSVPGDLSDTFVREIGETVLELDPEGRVFRVNDTGFDLEIMCLLEGVREPSKGAGIRFLDRALLLQISSGPTLVCGDTEADLPMLEAVVETGSETCAAFVTADAVLMKEVATVCRESCFVPFPDALLLALNRLSADAPEAASR